MKHNVAKYMEDIVLSVDDIYSYLSDTTSEETFLQNRMLYDAVCRRFGIIGEAMFQADKLEPQLAITDKKKIIGLRHIIIHGLRYSQTSATLANH